MNVLFLKGKSCFLSNNYKAMRFNKQYCSIGINPKWPPVSLIQISWLQIYKYGGAWKTNIPVFAGQVPEIQLVHKETQIGGLPN